MKLLRLATTLNPTSAPYNQFSLGLKSSLQQTYCSLMKHDISVEDGIKGFNGNGSILNMIKLVRGLIQKNHYDVVHIHSGVTGIIFFIAAFPFKLSMFKKAVFTLHNSWNIIKPRNQILNFVVMIFVAKICTCGKSSKESLPKIINFFIAKKTISVVNGFDHKRIDNIEDKKNGIKHYSDNSSIKILCVGALNNTKNQIALLDALKEIKVQCELIFLGDGKNKESLINFSKDINKNIDITFKGRISRNLAIEHMIEADVSISLSKGEGLPIAVLESMYSGCFLILSDIPPHKEISPPSNRCIFVKKLKKSEVVSSINFVADNIQSIRSERSVSRDHSIVNFGLEKMLGEYMEVYKFLNKRN
ncbi:glycosyltransferase family 4 protein [Gammaproteobacteria bacterium]|jgi:glycosyltransferase involved in cell wall biosynthesis|nr:glycosyltransferase family 4 protein [Gammaproteobacteria bacterium]MDC0387294.1 glycosyltransferase family 4 protein [Gammaproteobacteria bacterium]